MSRRVDLSREHPRGGQRLALYSVGWGGRWAVVPAVAGGEPDVSVSTAAAAFLRWAGTGIPGTSRGTRQSIPS
jgi:hypothetical protein